MAVGERNWIRKVVARTQEKLSEQGVRMENADLQALLWYYEKNLWSKLGYTVSRAKPTDYAIEAAKLVAGKQGAKA